MTDLPEDAALVIAQWAWPDREWVAIGTAATARGPIVPSLWCKTLNLDSWNSVHAAEQAAIERFLGVRYGLLLYREVEDMGAEETIACGLRVTDIGRMTLNAATAPIYARVRALYRLAKENP